MGRRKATAPDPATVTLESKLAWLEREHQDVQRFYPVLLREGIVPDRQAALNRLSILEAIRNDYKKALEQRDAKTFNR